MFNVLAAEQVVSLNAKQGSTFFGTGVAQDFVNGIGFYALIFTLIGLVLSAGLWAVGAFSNNYTQSINGKKGFLITAVAALVIGAAPFAINEFRDIGQNINKG